MTTESDVISALFDKYSPLGKTRGMFWDPAIQETREYQALQQWVCASHVRSDAGWDSKRTADFIAFDTHNTGNKGLAFHGHEVKVSRADWRTELKSPEKSEEFIQHCDYWYLVISDPAIVKDGELPPNWGLMILGENGLRTKVKAKRLTPLPSRTDTYPWKYLLSPVHRGFLTSFLRRVQEQAYKKGIEDEKMRVAMDDFAVNTTPGGTWIEGEEP